MRHQQRFESSDDFLGVDGAPTEDRCFARGTQELERLEPEHDRGGIREEHLVQIVHDLKNPLATIALDGALLDHKLERGETVDVRATLARILHNVEFLDRMVHDLLDGCAFDGADSLVLRQTDIRALLEAVIERSVSARERTRVLLEAPRSMTVLLDDLRIQRVVANLLSNACKYAPVASAIVVRLETYPDRCCVSVVDSGPGVSKKEAGYIFEKYRRTRTARAHEGSGLGLYVSKQIVEAHGGRIGVERAPGAGSRFFFELPAG